MTEDNFVDYVSLNVISGKGGRGSSHLRREKFVAKGGPDGGDGGNGGDIIFRGDANIWTLYIKKIKKRITNYICHFNIKRMFDCKKIR